MKKYVVPIAAISLLLICNQVYATVWYVHPDSTLNSIQVGIDSCSTGDTVLVGPGTYVEHIVWPNTQGIHLISELDPDVTIIDGYSTNSVIRITTGVDTTTIISGFTIQNGLAEYGGGIRCDNNSSPTITNNIITDNTADVRGGGIYCANNSSPTITENTITGNTSLLACGGGILCIYISSPTITGNTITGNTAGELGGGIECANNSSPIIADNTITLNHARAGGGISCFINSSPTITNNTITGNTAAYAGGGIVSVYESYPTITDNIITGNAADSAGGGIAFRESSPTITHNTIEGNTAHYGGGIYCDSSSLGFIDSCTISNNSGDGVYYSSASSPEIHWCNITDNTGYGVQNIDPGVMVDAEDNWWGDPSGPGGFGPGTGDSVSNYVDFTPWLQDSVEWVGIEEHEPSQFITTFLQISPNPFRDRVNIKFSMEHSAEVIELKIYDATGRLIKSFSHVTNQIFDQVVWDGRDDAGKKLPSGVYFLKLVTGDYSATEKLLLIR